MDQAVTAERLCALDTGSDPVNRFYWLEFVGLFRTAGLGISCDCFSTIVEDVFRSGSGELVTMKAFACRSILPSTRALGPGLALFSGSRV